VGTMHFTKHHGSGNDFLVFLQTGANAEENDLRADEVRALCDRHRGVGADGLIEGRQGSDGADLEMILRNADGSTAEMSGNGIRCLVQAAVAAGRNGAGTVVVDTGAGRRNVEYREISDGLGYAEVDMGPVLVGEDLLLEDLLLGQASAAFAGAGTVSRACAVNVGNPHVVLLAADSGPDAHVIGPDVSVIGPMIDGAVDGGVNVEVLRVRDATSIDIEVWERGVGINESCGTGACAAAVAAMSWGLLGDHVDVRRDGVEVRSGGGALRVKLGLKSVTLCGPARLIGHFTIDRGLLSALVAERRDEVVAAL
jgi:diaminopimelate epimerase